MILGNGQITATLRPAFPWAIQHTDTRNNKRIWKMNRPVPLNYGIPMDWHHIIPWKVLRDGWSALATSNRWEVLEAWIDLWNLDTATDTIIAAMQAGTLAAPVNAEMWDKLCWAEWNLVEGPTNSNRAPGDDPGSDGLDAFESLQMPNNVRNRSLILKSIYTHMRAWAANTNTITQSQAKPLMQDFKRMSPFKHSPVSRFDAKVWALVSEGRIDTYGLAKRHPTWRKAA